MDLPSVPSLNAVEVQTIREVNDVTIGCPSEVFCSTSRGSNPKHKLLVAWAIRLSAMVGAVKVVGAALDCR